MIFKGSRNGLGVGASEATFGALAGQWLRSPLCPVRLTNCEETVRGSTNAPTFVRLLEARRPENAEKREVVPIEKPFSATASLVLFEEA